MSLSYGDSAPDVASPWTAQAWTALPADGRHYEVIDGALLVGPAPSPWRQVVVRRLVALLEAAVPEGGAVRTGPAVIVGASLLVPDVLVLRPRAAAPAAPRGTVAAADVLLAVQVAEASNATAARLTTPALLAAAGVPAFWRLELEHEPSVTLYRLASDSYTVEGRLRNDQMQTITTPFQVSVRPRRLLAPIEGQAPPAELMARLRQLDELRDAGVLTAAEFQTKKAALLAVLH